MIIEQKAISCQYAAKPGNNTGWVRIYPEILLAAINNSKSGTESGAVRLWFIAKYFDKGGSGMIPAEGFRRWVLRDWKEGTYYPYLAQAEKMGIIERRGKYYRLAAAEHAALAVGCTHLNTLQTIRLSKLIGKDWLAYVYAAFMRQFNKQTIAAKTISELTGIPIRTIYHYDRLLGKGIKKRHNFALHKPAPTQENIAVYALDKSKHVFEYNGRLIERLPNQRFIYSGVAKQPKHTQSIGGKEEIVKTKNGQRKRINSAINWILNSSTWEGIPKGNLRRYIETRDKDGKEQVRTIKRNERKKAIWGNKASEFVYWFSYEKYKAGFYEVI